MMVMMVMRVIRFEMRNKILLYILGPCSLSFHSNRSGG